MLDLNDVKLVQPRERFDLDEIVHRLRAAAETWVPRHFPNGRREGDEWRLANIRGDAPRKNGSCVIALKGPHAGDWYDHDGGSGGGPLSTLENATGLSGRELFAHAAEEVGWASAAPARREPPPSSKEKDSQREIAIILSRASSIAGTLAETYLRSRGLAVPQCDDLRFHPDLAHWETKAGWPALIGVVRDCKNEIVGLHRIYLSSDGTAKAEITHPKKMLGKVSGGAARLAAIRDDGRLGLCEGIETGLPARLTEPAAATHNRRADGDSVRPMIAMAPPMRRRTRGVPPPWPPRSLRRQDCGAGSFETRPDVRLRGPLARDVSGDQSPTCWRVGSANAA